MTARPRPPRREPVDEFTSRVLARYRGETHMAILHRAARMLAQADGLVDASGNLKPRGGPR